MAIGRNFQESLQKALRSLEVDSFGFEPKWDQTAEDATNLLRGQLQQATPDRIWYVADAFRAGYSIAELHALTRIDPWFLAEIYDLIVTELSLTGKKSQNCLQSSYDR